MDNIEQLGFGFPSFQSQALGTRPNRGPWVSLTPRLRALRDLPPKAKANLRGLARLRGKMRGLGQEDWEILASDYAYEDAAGNVYGDWYSAVPQPQQWDTALPPVYEGSTGVTAGAVSSGSGFNFDWNALVKGATAVSQAVAQQRIIDLNIQRAKAGLPLLDPKNFSPSAAVNFGLTPQAQQMLLYGGLALGAVLLLKGRSKSK